MRNVVRCQTMLKAPPPTKEFPHGSKLWRVDWIREFRLNPLALSEPTVELIVTPYLEPVINQENVNSKFSYDHHSTQSIHIGCGQLPYLRIGSFLHEHEIRGTPAYRTETLRLTIGDTRSYIIRADDVFQYRGFNLRYIPPKYYPLPEPALSTRCLVVERDVANPTDVSKVIFPCAELLRYYFATSTELIKPIVNGNLNAIYDSDLTWLEEDGTGILQLRKNIEDDEAGVVARFALDSCVRSQVEYIHESIIANGCNGEGYVPVVRPPFTGETTMILHGKPMQVGRFWHFLVFWIEDCTGPYPYLRLKFARDNDGRTGRNKDRSRPEAWKGNVKSVRRPSTGTEEPEIRSDDEPSLYTLKTDLKLNTRRFSSMPTDIEKLEKIESRFRAANKPIFITQGETEGYSTADGNYGRDTNLDRLSISDLERASRERRLLTPDFETFFEMLEELKSRKAPFLDYRLVPVPPSELSEAQGNISFFPTTLRGGKRDRTLAWSFIPGPPRRRRRVIVAEVKYQEHYFYLFESERRPPVGEDEENITSLIVNGRDCEPLDHRRLSPVLLLCAKNGGVWVNNWQWPELHRHRVTHQFSAIERFVNKFLKRFHEFVPEIKVEAPSAASDSAPGLA